jgi:hypothetical protein
MSNNMMISEPFILKDVQVSHRVIWLKGLRKSTEDVRIGRIWWEIRTRYLPYIAQYWCALMHGVQWNE